MYDAWDQLVQVKNSGGTTIATDGHDGVGRHVTVAEGSITTTLYYSDEWLVLEERVGGAAKAPYVWSPVHVDAWIWGRGSRPAQRSAQSQ